MEIKAERDRGHAIDGENGLKSLAVKRWETLNPDRLKYEMIFAKEESLSSENLQEVRRLIQEPIA